MRDQQFAVPGPVVSRSAITAAWMMGTLSVVVSLILPVRCASAQFPFRNRNNEQALDQILLAPRPLTRLLREGETAIKEERYADGIAILGSLLLQEERDDLPEDALRQDFFTESGGEGYYKTSVRGEALRLLGSIPEEGRKTLEIQYGVAARQALQVAVAARDVAAISEIVRKYYHTDAGYDASVLLAQEKLARGFPIAAASILQRLSEFPAARKRFGAQLIGELSSAWIQAGRTDLAVAALEQGMKLFSGSTINLGSQQVRLDKPQDWKAILNRVYPQQSLAEQRSLQNWLITGGEPARNGSISAGLPLPTVAWDMTLHRDRGDEENVATMGFREAQAGVVLLPKMEARMVGDIVLAKTAASNLFAIDLDTGLRLWPFYKHLAPVELAPPAASLPFELEDSVANNSLKNRIWGSSAFGQFSCDTNQLYYISGPDDHQFDQPILGAMGSAQGSHNFLTGVSLQGQGKVMWHVGGIDGQNEPELAGAYFLGPPLSFEGELYALVEINLETRLVVLNARTGKMEWTQQLCMSTTSDIGKDPSRQTQALSPSISDAVIVCPAGNGAIVAVDLLSRSLLWGKQYPSNSNARHPIPGLNNFGGDIDSFDPSEERWHEPQVIIHKGQVVFTPAETNSLLCLDLLTGAPLWQNPRGSARYVAGIHNDRVIIVGNSEVSAVNLADGHPSWSDVLLASRLPTKTTEGTAASNENKSQRIVAGRDRETVAGKAVRDGRYLYVPTSAQRVLKIDIEAGRLIDAATVEQPLGNLFSYKDRMISVGATRIACYYTRDALAEEVEQRLAANPRDTWALNQQALIYMADKRIKEAIALLRQSYAIRPDDGETRYMLASALLTGLEEDFDGYLSLATELEPIIESQHFRFLVLLVKGNLRSGQYELAFTRLIELMRERLHTRQPSSQSRIESMQLGSNHEVDIDTWIAAQLAMAYEQAAPQQREKMVQLVKQRLDLPGGNYSLSRQMELQYLAWLEIAQPAVLTMAEELLGDADQSLGERILQPVLYSANAKLREAARAALGRAIHVDSNADGEGLTVTNGRQISRTGQSADIVPPAVQWPRGMVEGDVKKEPGMVSFGQNRLKQVGTRYGRPGIQLGLSSGHLVIFNELGNVLNVFEFDRGNMDGTDSFLRCQVDGGLIFLETQNELAAFDMYRGRESAQEALLWRHSLTRAATNVRMPTTPTTVSQVNTLGIQLPMRGAAMREALVGPVTPVGILIQKGTDLVMLSPMSGGKLWSRGGYDDRTTLARHKLEVAVVNASSGKIDVLDCRDGSLLRQLDYRGDWSTWFTSEQHVVQTIKRESSGRAGGAIQDEASSGTAIRLLNVFTGQVVLEQEFEPASRADSSDDRYLVVLEPSGKLWYCDAQTGKVAEHTLAPQPKLERVRLQRFEDRLVVLTSAPASTPQITVLPKASEQAVSNGLHPVNGNVIALSAEDGSMLWDRPATLTNFTFPNVQPRRSPFMVCYRVVKPNSGGAATAHLVAIDLRDGTLAYFNTNMSLQSSANMRGSDNYEFGMEITAGKPEIRVSIGTYSTTLTVTETEKPPQPVCVFGALPIPSAQKSSFDIFNPSP